MAHGSADDCQDSPVAQEFLSALTDTTLSASPHVIFRLPYLYTKAGAKCQVRPLIKADPYQSPSFGAHSALTDTSKDCMNIEHHQRIDLLYSFRADQKQKSPTPLYITMHYFGQNDSPLGSFIDSQCLAPDRSWTSQVFAHQDARVTVSMERLKTPMEHPQLGGKDTIFMWSWCKECQQVTPVTAMSPETYAMSLGKYLELSFSGDDFIPREGECTHSIYRHHIRYVRFEHHGWGGSVETAAASKRTPVRRRRRRRERGGVTRTTNKDGVVGTGTLGGATGWPFSSLSRVLSWALASLLGT